MAFSLQSVQCHQQSSGLAGGCGIDDQICAMSADSLHWCLLQAWILPKDDQGEFPFLAEANAGAVVVALVGLALLLGGKIKEPLGHRDDHVALALAEGAAHRLRRRVAGVFSAEEAAPGLGAVSGSR